MFSTGPKSLLNECLSKQTQDKSEVAIILAALGSFLIKASSPKYPPTVYSLTTTGSPDSFNCFVALAVPCSTMKNSFPSSPSLKTVSPSLNCMDFKASASWDLSYGSISCNSSTYDKNSSHFSLFLIAASFTILLKQALSRTQRIASPSDFIVAALGALYNKASSPKDSPGL
mmetsp:Transcript_21499/g.3500  ORF Transcript_21499/g.3500 Transcript_21499/m.3500 type:complete len:172 (+) Transcript_21499:908-1423(+)